MERPWTLDQPADGKATIQPLTFEDLFADEHERLYRAVSRRREQPRVKAGDIDVQ